MSNSPSKISFTRRNGLTVSVAFPPATFVQHRSTLNNRCAKDPSGPLSPAKALAIIPLKTIPTIGLRMLYFQPQKQARNQPIAGLKRPRKYMPMAHGSAQ
jgi:hypothetical protein